MKGERWVLPAPHIPLPTMPSNDVVYLLLQYIYFYYISLIFLKKDCYITLVVESLLTSKVYDSNPKGNQQIATF